MAGSEGMGDALHDLQEEALASLLHLSTSPIPVLMRMDPDIAVWGPPDIRGVVPG